eukprot:6189210-Pleurochrysis_carterae.AAC.1
MMQQHTIQVIEQQVSVLGNKAMSCKMEFTAPESSHAIQLTTGPSENAMGPGCPEADSRKSLSAA